MCGPIARTRHWAQMRIHGPWLECRKRYGTLVDCWSGIMLSRKINRRPIDQSVFHRKTDKIDDVFDASNESQKRSVAAMEPFNAMSKALKEQCHCSETVAWICRHPVNPLRKIRWLVEVGNLIYILHFEALRNDCCSYSILQLFDSEQARTLLQALKILETWNPSC